MLISYSQIQARCCQWCDRTFRSDSTENRRLSSKSWLFGANFETRTGRCERKGWEDLTTGQTARRHQYFVNLCRINRAKIVTANWLRMCLFYSSRFSQILVWYDVHLNFNCVHALVRMRVFALCQCHLFVWLLCVLSNRSHQSFASHTHTTRVCIADKNECSDATDDYFQCT